MKILSTEQIRQADAYTIENEPIKSIDLMERASSAFTNLFITKYNPKQKIAILCGRGNNGGDGLAIGRMLLQKNYAVDVYVVDKEGKSSVDFGINKKRLEKISKILNIQSENNFPNFKKYDTIIDALFGSGLTRPVEGIYEKLIRSVNQSEKNIVSVDIASGLFADHQSAEGAIMEADVTISFQFPKTAFLLPQNFPYVGEWRIVDTGLASNFIESQICPYQLVDKKLISKTIRQRGKFDHKGTWGKAMVIAGSYGKMGAAVLSAKAAMRSGLGLLTMYVPVCGYEILQTAIPEAMVELDEGDHFLTSSPNVDSYDALGIGPGLGKEYETTMCLIQTVRSFKKPVVIDADGLNIMSEHREIQEMLPEGSILTPHPKEFERLVGEWGNDFERLELQKKYASDHKVIVVLKGAHTSIALPDGKVYFNSTGNPGMATGGSGDVLTGIITSILAQGYQPSDAAVFGVYIHGLAGDLASQEKGVSGLIASDIIEHLPTAFKEFKL